MAAAQELATKIRANAETLVATGGYSVEAEALIVIAKQLADLADRVAMLDNLARTDIGQIVDAIVEGRRVAPVGELPRIISLPDSSSE